MRDPGFRPSGRRPRLSRGSFGRGDTVSARPQPLSAPGNDTNAQILEIIRRRQEEAKARAKTVPPTTLLKQPDTAELRLPDGNAPRNLLESAQALAAQRKARDAANPAAQPTGLQPAVFRPGQQQQLAGLGQSVPGGIVKAQAPAPIPIPSPFGPIPVPQPGQGTMPSVEEINRMGDWLGQEFREGMQRALPHTPAGKAFLLGQAVLQGLDQSQFMAPAEPMPPLPPSEAQEGGPVNFPGQDPEQGKADSASGPLITPVPRETTPSTAGGYGEERDELPDMSALDIRPIGTEDLGKPAEQVLGKGKQALLPNQDEWLKTDEAKRLSEFRDQRQKSGQSTPPYGPVWQNLKPNKGGANRGHNGFRFEWDRRHGGEIEVFEDEIHIGVVDPVTGNWLKPGDSKKNGQKGR